MSHFAFDPELEQQLNDIDYLPSSRHRPILGLRRTLPRKGTSMAAAIFGRYTFPESGAKDIGRSGYQSCGFDRPVQDLYEKADQVSEN